MVNNDVNKSKLKKLEYIKKKLLMSMSGLLLITTLMSCKKQEQEEYKGEVINDNNYVAVLCANVEEIDFSNFDLGISLFSVIGTNLHDVSSLSKYKNLSYIDISNNLVTDVSPLESLPNLTILNISKNSVLDLDISNFKSLKVLHINGNYNLYTEELYD